MYLQQLSNVQGEEDNGGSDQGEEHEEVGELGDDDDGDVLECIYDLFVSGQKSSGCKFLKNGTDTRLSRKRERQKQPRWEISLKDKRFEFLNFVL